MVCSTPRKETRTSVGCTLLLLLGRLRRWRRRRRLLLLLLLLLRFVERLLEGLVELFVLLLVLRIVRHSLHVLLGAVDAREAHRREQDPERQPDDADDQAGGGHAGRLL